MMDKDSSIPLVRVWLLGAFHVEHRAADGGWESIEKSHWEKGYIRSFFKRLLSAHGRRLDRFTLLDDLWPDPENAEPLERYLNDAAYKLRKALRPAEVLHTFGHGSGYQLADQSLLWVDADASEALIAEAERIGRTSAAALPLLEQARTYFARGDYLEGESGLWVYARRGTLERLRYRCLIWLAEAYEQQGMMGQTEMVYNALLEENPADEDTLCRLMGLLHRQGMTSQALRCYEETKKQLKHLGQRLSPSTDTFAKRLLSEPRQIEMYGVKKTNLLYSAHENKPSVQPSSHSFATQDIIGEWELEGRDMDHLRRQIIQQALKVTGVAVFTDDIGLNSDMAERLLRVLTRPSSIDERTLRYLEQRTESYWQDRHGAIVASADLFGYVSEHFQKIIELLEGSLLPTQRLQLCAIASKTALLIGELLLDMGYYRQARSFDGVAITAAQEANDRTLEAVSHGRLSLAWTYSKNFQKALSNIQKARSLAVGTANVTVCSWLAAIEAEAQANHHNNNACLKALDEAERIEDQPRILEYSYFVHFDCSLLRGYQGVCFRQLYHPDNTQSTIFLEKARQVLIDSLTLLEPTMIQRQPTFLTDLANIYLQQGKIEEACESATKAVGVAAQIKLQKVLQRLHQLRFELEPWKDTQEVKNFDRHFITLLT